MNFIDSRFLIQDFLNWLLCFLDIKQSCPFVPQIVAPFDLNILGRPDVMALQQYFQVKIDFKT